MTAPSAKTIVKLTRFCPVVALCLWAPAAGAQSLISNGTFDTTDTAPWWGYQNSTTDYPADETIAVENGQLCVTMTAGGQNPWDVILGISSLALTANQYYHIGFTISADVDRTIKFKTGFGDVPYTDYFLKTIPVTTTPTPVNYTYLNLRNDAAAQFQFQIGSKAGKVCFDDIVLEPVVTPTVPAYTTPAMSGHPFKDYKAIVKMGTAVDTPMFLSSPQHNAIVAGEFSMITPANSMKMNIIQPTQGVFDFTDTDALVAWAATNGLEFRGHPLVWHTQVPSWLTDGTFTRDDMIAIMYSHIDTLMGRYVGKFPYWDVVNEAINQEYTDDTMTTKAWTWRKTLWHDRIGDDFMDLAFQRAHMADPNAKLAYNDYNIEQKGNGHADKVFEVVKDMKMRGIPIDVVGFQGHYYVEPDGSTSSGVPNMQAIRDNMARYAEIGVDVHVTECDFRIGKPLDDAKSQIQTKFYADFLQACIDAPNCSHFTLWGLSDADSWVPSTFPDYDYAHVWDTNLMPKQSYFAMSQVFAQYNTDGTPLSSGGSAGSGAGGGAGTSAGAGAGAGGGAGTSAGGATGGSAGSGSTPPAAANKSSGESSGCSVEPNGGRSSSTLLSALALLGLAFSRRRASRGTPRA